MIARLSVLFVLLWAVFGASAAQDAAPIVSVAAGDFRALATASGGQRLWVADAAVNQVRVYDFSVPESPTLIDVITTDGMPVAVAASQTFALVAVAASGDTDLIQVVTPLGRSRQASYSSANYIEVPDDVRTVRLSSDGRWAVVVSASAYTTLEIVSPYDINSTVMAIPTAALSDALIIRDRLWLARADDAVLELAAIGEHMNLEAEGSLRLSEPSRALAVNAAGTLGAALVGDHTLLLFDPASLEIIGTYTPDAAPIREVVFLQPPSGERIALLHVDSSIVTLLDAPESAAALQMRPLPLVSAVRTAAPLGELLAVTDGQMITLYDTNP